jgi:PIN domain nuclease of toxin-antitoxin system
MRGVLLDTHTLLWLVGDDAQLGSQAKDILFDSGTQKYLSPASYWELAIKIRIGKLALHAPYDEFIRDAMALHSLEILHVQPQHTSILTTLDLHHGDPFDRLLIAQATTEDIPIISIDGKFDMYSVNRIWNYLVEPDDNVESEDGVDDEGGGGEEE